MHKTLDAISAEFKEAVAPFKPEECGVEKHGSWQWFATSGDELHRSVGLAIIPTSNDGEPLRAESEVWIGADTTDRFVRRTVGSVPESVMSSFDAFIDALRVLLRDAVRQSSELRESDLAEAYVTFPRTRRVG